MKLSDKRQFPRAPFTFPVDCIAGSLKFRSPATNLGGGGVFVHSSQQLVPGAEVILRFRAAKHLPVVRATGRVRFQVPGLGFGVEFKEMSKRARNALLRLIHHRTIGRRKNVRVPLVTQIEFQDGQALAMVRDISYGGMFIERRGITPTGTQVHLRFNLQPEGPAVIARAEVAYVIEGTGMGVQFVEVGPDDLGRIQSYVESVIAARGVTPSLPESKNQESASTSSPPTKRRG